MPRLEDRQAQFAAALLDAGRAMPGGLVGPDGSTCGLRFDVYRNNVVAGLVRALKESFPAVARLVGDQYFSAMARIYAASEPPESPLMFDYGKGFPGFIASFRPADGVLYLSDVAWLERAWLESYHAADAPALDAGVLALLPVEALPRLRMKLHPSVRLVQSRYPVLEIWQMSLHGGTPHPVDLDCGGDEVLLVRPAASVDAVILPAGSSRFVEALVNGLSVEKAVGSVVDLNAFDLTGCLSALLANGAFCGYELEGLA